MTRPRLAVVSCIAILASWAALFSQTNTSPDSTLVLTKPVSSTEQNLSGDRQYAVAGSRLSRPLKVRLVTAETATPVAGIPVYFELVSHPQKAKSFYVEKDVVHTDAEGYAETFVKLGTISGEYEFTAKIRNGRIGDDLVVFKAFARKSNWVFFLVMGLAGGLGMFLYGMNLMSEGMKKTAGDRMRTILSKLTFHRLIAVAVGAFVTMVIQSSSATTVMLVSFVQAQLMTFAQSFGIILGAHIGTTMTAQLVAFKLTDYSLLMVAIGIAAMFVAKEEKFKNIGETVFGFGLLFFGMKVMSESMYPLRTFDPFISLLVTLENPILGILVGAVFTALIQSSSAFTGILIVLAIQGVLTLEAGIPLIFGANIGTCVTAGLAAVSASRDAKRVALAHTLFQVAGVLIYILWIPQFADLIRWLSPKGPADLEGVALLADIVPRQIANAHTVFNVTTTLIVLPFIYQAARLIVRLLPHIEEPVKAPYETKFIDESLLTTPALALSLAKAEVLHMGEIARDMTRMILDPFMARKREVLTALDEEEQKVNFLEERINAFLTKISQRSIPEEQVDETFQMMYAVTEFEQIADIVSKTLRPRAYEWLGSNLQFSKPGKQEIEDYHLLTLKQLSRALDAFREFDLQKAQRMKRKYKKYRAKEETFIRTHFERLREAVPESKATSEYHQDLMEQFRRINSHATNIARILLEWSGPRDEEAGQK